MTFRLTTLLYLFALVAASLAFLGTPGLLLAVGVQLVCAAILQTPRLIWANWIVILGVLAVILVLLLPPFEMGSEEARKEECQARLTSLARSAFNFHDVRGELPPSSGRRGINDDIHSWRVQVLPFTEASHYYFILRYTFDEPWNGPKNRQLLSQSPIDLHCCPAHSQPFHTNYFAITGPETAWGDGSTRSPKDITDGTNNTILLIEAAGRGVHWAEPKDLTFDEAVDLLASPIVPEGSDGHRVNHGYFYKSSYVRNVAMCDGSARALHAPIPRENAIALLTASGGESVDIDLIERYSTPQLDYARVWAFSVFVVLALLPAVPQLRPWIWPRGAERRSPGDPLEPSESEFPGKTASSDPENTRP